MITNSPINGPLRHAPAATASSSESVKPKTPEPSLWAVPPQHLLESSSQSESTNTSTTSVPLWHIPPPNSSQTDSSATSFEAETSHGDLWPVDEDHPEYQETVASKNQAQSAPPPETETDESKMFHTVEYKNDEPASEAENSKQEGRAGVRSVHFASPGTAAYTPPDEELEALSLNDKPTPGRARNGSHLQIKIPSNDVDVASRSPRTPKSKTPISATSTSPTSTSQETVDAEEEVWGERPSIEKLYRDIDKYLPGHDLDKEIIIETQTAAANSPAPRRLQGHKKSVRVVAKEAQEAHRNWRQAMNVVRVNNILRRRSTKMWGRKVEQVKPGMVVEANTIAKDSHTAAHPGDKPSK